jgi:hypothetical protein
MRSDFDTPVPEENVQGYALIPAAFTCTVKYVFKLIMLKKTRIVPVAGCWLFLSQIYVNIAPVAGSRKLYYI